MIVPMKKVFLVSLETAKDETLSKLREIGVLHIDEVPGQSEVLDQLIKTRDSLVQSLRQLPLEEKKYKPGTSVLSEKKMEEALEVSGRVGKLSERRTRLIEQVEKLRAEIERVEVLGDFDPEDLELIGEHGLDIVLFDLNKEELESFPQELTSFRVYSKKNGAILAAVLPEDSGLTEEYPLFELPKYSVKEMRQQVSGYFKKIEEIDDELLSLSQYGQLLYDALMKVEGDIEFEKVRLGLNEEGALVYLTGFVPEKKVDRLKSGARKNGWALIVRDPEPDEPIPTLVDNPKPVGIIKPVFDFLGTVPGYYEYDISFYFLLFLTLFFAMIIGDAGYGLLFLGTTLYSAFKFKKAKGSITTVHTLMVVMSSATIVWGALSGVWFGSITLAETAPFSWFVLEPIYGFGGEAAQETIKYLCFIIGTVHLSIAHIWNFLTEWRRDRKLKAISQLGWLLMVLGLYFLVLYLVLDPEKYPIPQFSLYMVGIGLVLVFLFSEQEGHFLKGVLKGLANFMPKALDSISAFSDIISYIRLFAVGLATVEIAKSFNSMAADLGNSVVGIIGGIVILLIGHGLNIAMAALSVVVHGVRLNVLEFSGHLGMEWTGIPYDPFRDRMTTNLKEEGVT
ncbi:MAG TPA: V-type ATP synthase subunit I [Sediminispirochaeta sp.]|nr:V-type ATP synthase subunit I [Sediminispirochaeta sp.]